jgi:hypothetical protein
MRTPFVVGEGAECNPCSAEGTRDAHRVLCDFMIAGDFAAYFLGLLVEYEWGPQVSLIVFLALYFLSLWVAWVLSVWVTKPRGATSTAT